jgi:hypothetical protein
MRKTVDACLSGKVVLWSRFCLYLCLICYQRIDLGRNFPKDCLSMPVFLVNTRVTNLWFLLGCYWILLKCSAFVWHWSTNGISPMRFLHAISRTIVAGFQTRRPDFDPVKVVWDWWWTKWNWDTSPSSTLFPLPIRIPPDAPYSSVISGCTVRRMEAEVPIGPSLNPPHENKKQAYCRKLLNYDVLVPFSGMILPWN